MAASLKVAAFLPLIARLCAALGAAAAGLSLAALAIGALLPGQQIAYASAGLDDRSGVYLLDVGHGFSRRLIDGYESVWSSDGERLVFMAIDGDFDLFTFDMQSGLSRRLTQDAAFEFGVTWSPDGTMLAFSSTRLENYEIYRINTDGTNLLRLTENPNSEVRPVWSPDGQHIAFISNRDGIAGDAYVMDIDGGSVRRLTYRAGVADLDWSPDGERMAVIASPHGLLEIFVMDADGGTDAMSPDDYLERLTHNITLETRLDWSPSGAPDGDQIVFSMRGMDGRSRLFKLDIEAALAGGDLYEPQPLIENERDNSAPMWRPR